MKAIVEAHGNIKTLENVAARIHNEFIANVGLWGCDASGYGYCEHGGHLWWDDYWCKVGLAHPHQDIFILEGTTTSGTLQGVEFNVKSGRIRAWQDGRRGSSLGAVADFLPNMWWEVSKSLNWRLVEYRTSRRDWNVRIPIVGSTFGSNSHGITCLREEEEHKARVRAGRLLNKCQALGVELPRGLEVDVTSKTGLAHPDGDRWVDFNPPIHCGVLYRRGKAVGAEV